MWERHAFLSRARVYAGPLHTSAAFGNPGHRYWPHCFASCLRTGSTIDLPSSAATAPRPRASSHSLAIERGGCAAATFEGVSGIAGAQALFWPQTCSTMSRSRTAQLVWLLAAAAALRTYDPRPVVSRRAFAVALVASSTCIPPAAQADDAQSTPPSFAEFGSLLRSRKVQSVRFSDSAGLRGTAVLIDGANVEIGIGEGWPLENPSSPESAYQVVAKIRDAGVPYSFSFDLTRFNGSSMKAKAFKNKNALAAERLGEEEAARVARKRAAEAKLEPGRGGGDS